MLLSRRGRERYLLGFFDQGLQSGGLFLMTLFWGRMMTGEEFGVFALGQVVALYVGALHVSLLAEPFSVNFARFAGEELSSYLRWAIRFHWLLCGGACVILLGLAGIFALAGSSCGAKVLVCAALCAPAYFTLWQTRGVCYARVDPVRALKGTLMFLGVLGCGITLIHALRRDDACLAMVVFALAVVPVGLLFPRDLAASDRSREQGWWRDHWGYAKWHLGGNLMAGFGNFIAYPVLAYFGGVKAGGALRLVETLYAPVNQALTSLALVVLPRLSDAREEGGMVSVVALLRRVRWVLLAGLLPLPVLAIFWGDWGMQALFGADKGSGLGLATILFSGIIIGRVLLDYGPVMVLRVARDTRAFWVNGWIVGAAAGLTTAIAAAFSIEWVIVSRFCVILVSWCVFMRYMKSNLFGNSL